MSQCVVIFGANGPTGQLLTTQALSEGFTVTAVTRHPEAFGQRHDALHVVQGDVYDPVSVARAIEGQDVVLSVVGVPYSWKHIDVYSQSVRAIVQGMHTAGVKRLLCTSSGGTNPHYDPAEGFIFGRIIKNTIGRSTYVDMRQQEALVMASDLDWTIVRPWGLIKRTETTAYEVKEGYSVPGKQRTARIDVADFMIANISSTQYVRKGVAIVSAV